MFIFLAASLAAVLASAAPPANAESAKSVETVIVRAARTPIPQAATGSSVRVMDQTELEARQVISLADLLRSIPGVAVSRAGGFGAQTQVRVRGAEANHVLVLIDGVVANDPAQGDEFNFAHLLNNQLSRVEVIRGPQSALWGSSAVAGVINVVSAIPAAGSAVELLVEGGSHGYQRLSANAAHATQALQLRLGASRVHSDGQNVARAGTEKDGYDNTSASLGLGYQIAPAFRLDGQVRVTESATDFDGVDFLTGIPADRDNQTDSDQVYARVAAALDTLDGRWSHQLSVNLTDNNNRNTTQNGFAVTGFDVNRAAARTVHYAYQSSFELAQGHRLTAAFERREQKFRQRGPIGFGNPNRNESLHWNSWVGEYQGELTRDFSVLASIRHDRNSAFDDATTGRISGAWWVNAERTKLRAAYGTGVKNPTFSERFGFFTDFVGNPNLKPESSRGWEAGIDQRLLDGRFVLELTWFDDSLKDEINGFVFDSVNAGFTAANESGESERRGIELGGRWQITDHLEMAFAYTWLDATEAGPAGRQVDEVRRAEHIAHFNVDWAANQRLSLNLNVDHNGGQDDLFFPPVPPFQERVSLDSFTLVNLALRYQIGPSISVFARVENLFDENYEEIFGFTAPGRAAYAGIRYQPLQR